MIFKMVEITPDILVDPSEVCSLENYDERTPSGAFITRHKAGTIIVLKNGRKIFVKDLKPNQVKDKLK